MRLSEIYHNIEKSPFIVEKNNYKFYFSSLFYKNKFENNVDEFVCSEVLKFNQKYKVTSSEKLEVMIMLLLYRKIEKRGFYVIKNKDKLTLNYTLENL